MPTKRYEESLYEDLKNPQEAIAYLNAALEDEMPEVFLIALRDVSEAWGVSKIADKADLNRENLYRMLSSKGNPRYSSLKSLLNAMGLDMAITTKAA